MVAVLTQQYKVIEEEKKTYVKEEKKRRKEGKNKEEEHNKVGKMATNDYSEFVTEHQGRTVRPLHITFMVDTEHQGQEAFNFLRQFGVITVCVVHVGCKQNNLHAHAVLLMLVKENTNSKTCVDLRTVYKHYFQAHGHPNCRGCRYLASRAGQSSKCRECVRYIQLRNVKDANHLDNLVEYIKARKEETEGRRSPPQSCTIHVTAENGYDPLCQRCVLRRMWEINEPRVNAAPLIRQPVGTLKRARDIGKPAAAIVPRCTRGSPAAEAQEAAPQTALHDALRVHRNDMQAARLGRTTAEQVTANIVDAQNEAAFDRHMGEIADEAWEHELRSRQRERNGLDGYGRAAAEAAAEAQPVYQIGEPSNGADAEEADAGEGSGDLQAGGDEAV